MDEDPSETTAPQIDDNLTMGHVVDADLPEPLADDELRSVSIIGVDPGVCNIRTAVFKSSSPALPNAEQHKFRFRKFKRAIATRTNK